MLRIVASSPYSRKRGGGFFAACSGEGGPVRRCTPPAPAHPARHGPLDDTRVERDAGTDTVASALDRHREAPYATTFLTAVLPWCAGAPGTRATPRFPAPLLDGGPQEPIRHCNPVVARHIDTSSRRPRRGPPADHCQTVAVGSVLGVAHASARAIRRGQTGGGRARGAAWLSSTGHPSWDPVLACTVAPAQVLCGRHGLRALLEGPPGGGGINWACPSSWARRSPAPGPLRFRHRCRPSLATHEHPITLGGGAAPTARRSPRPPPLSPSPSSPLITLRSPQECLVVRCASPRVGRGQCPSSFRRCSTCCALLFRRRSMCSTPSRLPQRS